MTSLKFFSIVSLSAKKYFKKNKVPKNISFLGKNLIFNFFNAPISCVTKVIQPKDHFRIFIKKVGFPTNTDISSFGNDITF